MAVFDETGKLLTAKASPNYAPFDLEAAFAAKREDLMQGLSVHYDTGDHFVVLAPTRFGKDNRHFRRPNYPIIARGCRQGGETQDAQSGMVIRS